MTTTSTSRGFRSVLVPIELAPSADRVVERAARIPLAPRARLTLLHVVPRRPWAAPTRERARAVRAALAAIAARLACVLPPDVAVRCAVVTGTAAETIVRQAHACRAELVVMGRVGGRAVRDVLVGSNAERVVRGGQVPVLIVRLAARRPYRRPLCALDDDDAASPALALACRLLPPPRPAMTIVHVCEPSRAASVAARESEAYRRDQRERATAWLTRLLARADAGAGRARWSLAVRFGSPRSVLARMRAEVDADLLVLGTHARSGVAQAFLGTVAGDLLRAVPCDVLLVPPSHG